MAGNYEDIENVLNAAYDLPEFPMKRTLLQSLEKRNVNEYGRALEIIGDLTAADKRTEPNVVTALEKLATQIRLLEASEQVSE